MKTLGALDDRSNDFFSWCAGRDSATGSGHRQGLFISLGFETGAT
jgi:hypothetical protein